MAILSSRYYIREVLSVGTSFRELLTGRHLNNPYIVKLFAKLIVLIDELQESIAFHEQETLAEDSDAMDHEFSEAYKKLRSLIEVKAGLPEMGLESEKCHIMSEILNRHDRDLHELSKDEQINAWDSVMKEFNFVEEEEDSMVDHGGVRKLYTPVVVHHKELKAIEKKRAELGSLKKEVRSPSDISKNTKPVIQKIYDHLQDFADLEEPEYIQTINDVDAKIAPVVTRVKARTTRNKHSAEKDASTDVDISTDVDTSAENGSSTEAYTRDDR